MSPTNAPAIGIPAQEQCTNFLPHHTLTKEETVTSPQRSDWQLRKEEAEAEED
jgi:hypothetical protein